MSATPRRGLLLLNLGTPDDSDVASVRRYLAEFLMDADVLDTPWIIRAFLVYGVILRSRPQASAEAYQKIWGPRGSPLRYFSQGLCEKVQALLGPDTQVELAMRYGNPSISKALASFAQEGVRDVLAMPLYPQYSLSATLSSEKAIMKANKELGTQLRLSFVPPFYAHPAFLRSFESQISQTLAQNPEWDHLLMSFHGLPERHVIKTDPTRSHCLKSPHCCDSIGIANKDCYRAQSYATARSLAAALKIPQAKYSVSFQSRLGRDPWIKPYTDEVLIELARKGVKRLVVACPAFVADCLETLEEIQIRARNDFMAAGGEDLKLVPSLNDESHWATGLVEIANDASINPARNP